MPGRISMDQHGVMGSDDLKKDRSQAQGGALKPSLPVAQGRHVPQAEDLAQHNTSDVLPNGSSTAREGETAVNGTRNGVSVTLAQFQEPPELDQSWQQSAQNKDLGVLVSRLAQQCYFDLNTTLTKMSELPVPQPTAQANGILPHALTDTSEASIERKRLLAEFGNDQRDRFIKTLVLSDWARNEVDMAKMIDLKVWQDSQRFAQRDARLAVGQIKADTVGARLPSPNIGRALELFATSKASWVPDLGYIPPKRLSAKQLLQTLKNMNFTLATRLNLQDEPAPYMQTFTIADGRATFTVLDEFEVDLSVADEDPTTPFYFIDLRFLFSPSPNALDERLRGPLEGKINAALAVKGLQGCYDFLHNFVLTHKINTLRSQAQELIRGKWFDCIRVENLRRSMVVQYWVNMPGPKSWFEIGISSGKMTGAKLRKRPRPTLSVRWFRNSAEVTDEPLNFDWQELDLEKCLLAVVTKHASFVLRELKDRLQALAPQSEALTVDLTGPKANPEGSVLCLGLPSLRSPLQVRLEPVTGQVSISPPTLATMNAERRLNADANVDKAKWIASVMSSGVQEQVSKQAELLGWTYVGNLANQNLTAAMGVDVRQRSVYACSECWGDKWALAVTFGLGGEQWWVVRIEEEIDGNAQATGKTIKDPQKLNTADPSGKEPPVSQASLLRIEKLAVAQVSFSVLSQELRKQHIGHDVEKLAFTSFASQAGPHSSQFSASIFVRFSDLMRNTVANDVKPWGAETIRLTHQGIVAEADANDGSIYVQHDLRLMLEPGKLKQLREHLGPGKREDIAINATGALALRLRTPFGHGFVERIQSRLRNVQRLDHYVTILRKMAFSCTTVGLTQLAFTYSTAPQLSANLTFSDNYPAAQLRLEPKVSNPHLRIKALLQNSMDQSAEGNFEEMVNILAFTLPPLRAFDRLESVKPSRRALAVHVHGALDYLLRYDAPLPRYAVSVKAHGKVEYNKRTMKWFIQNATQPDVEGIPNELLQAIKAMEKENGEGWFGTGDGIVTETHGITTVLCTIDSIVRRFESSTDDSVKVDDGAVAGPVIGAGQQAPKPVSGTGLAPAPLATKKSGSPATVIELD